MDRDAINAFCETLPGAECTDPWGGGHDAWKIGGKMFASMGVANDGVSVKTPDIETAELLIDLGKARKAPYFHKSWVQIGWNNLPEDEMQDRLRVSYDLVRSKLPKKVQATLG
jgi:predicted DNA-binding protein (MmcQ/YjbR family)